MDRENRGKNIEREKPAPGPTLLSAPDWNPSRSRERAASVIFVHNHPSGDPTPSKDDRDLTRHLCETGALLDIPVLDHIIIARSGYVSFKDEGLM